MRDVHCAVSILKVVLRTDAILTLHFKHAVCRSRSIYSRRDECFIPVTQYFNLKNALCKSPGSYSALYQCFIKRKPIITTSIALEERFIPKYVYRALKLVVLNDCDTQVIY